MKRRNAQEVSHRDRRLQRKRDYPILEKTSLLSIHIRFGTISIRELMRRTRSLKSAGAEAWVAELIWREFYKMILFKFPHVKATPSNLSMTRSDGPVKRSTLKLGKMV